MKFFENILYNTKILIENKKKIWKRKTICTYFANFSKVYFEYNFDKI